MLLDAGCLGEALLGGLPAREFCLRWRETHYVPVVGLAYLTDIVAIYIVHHLLAVHWRLCPV